MKKLLFTFLFIGFCHLTLLAQNQKLHRIDYRTTTAGKLNNQDINPDNYYFRAWFNDTFIKVSVNEQPSRLQIINKKTDRSFLLFPESEQYYIYNEGNDKEGGKQDVESEEKIEFVPGKTKTIAGIPCKLAILTGEFYLQGEELSKIEVWYSEKLPKLYWDNFAFLKEIPGAVMELKIGEIGLIAYKLTQESLSNSEFEIPSYYSELVVDNDEGEYLEEDSTISDDPQVDEDRFLYHDEAGNLMGLKDENDNPITEAIYGYFDYFNGGISTVINADSKYGAMDKDGNIKIPFKYDFLAYDPEYQQYIYAENDKFGILGANDEPIIKAQYDMVSHMSHGYLTATVGAHTGILDRSGKVVVPISHQLILEFNAEVFVSNVKEQYVLYNIKQNKIISPGYDLISLSEKDPLHLVQKAGKFGYINNQGKLIIPIKYSSATTFEDGIASVMDSDDGDAYFINSKGEKVTIE